MSDLLTSNTLFLRWVEEDSQFQEWRYIGNGEHVPVFAECTITKWCRWCNEDTPARREQGIQWIKNGRPEAQLCLVDESAPDWKDSGRFVIIYPESEE